jgi:hypothetical protein
MKRLFCANVVILLVIGLARIDAAAAGGSNPSVSGKARATPAARGKAKTASRKTEERLLAAEERAREAEARALQSQEEAARATSEAKLAQEQAREALEVARQANAALTQIQQRLSQTEPAKAEALSNAKAQSGTTAQSAANEPAKNPVSNPPQSEGAVTSVSKFPVKVYGSLLLNATFGDGGSNNIDVPLFAQKRDASSDQNHENFSMTSRQSRLGLRYEGNAFQNARLTGVFEFDLFGGKPALPNGEHFDLFRLRLAYGRIDWQNDSFEAGQDWSVFSPLNPTTLASYAIPGFATSGNLWYRMPQIRYEHREKLGEKAKLIFTTALLDPNGGDNAGNPALRPVGLGERSALPAFETRLGFTAQTRARESSGGFSLHYSRQLAVPGNPSGALFERDLNAYGLSGDWSLWVSSWARVSGEAFHGQGLGVFSGGIAQSVAVLGGLPKSIRSTGGWFELHTEAPVNYNGAWKKVNLNFGYGLEDNRAEDLAVGMRKRNQTVMGNTLYKFLPSFAFAVEYRQVRTDWFRQPSAKQRLNWLSTALLFSF